MYKQFINEKLRLYDLIANDSALIYKCKVKIISHLMTWDGLVTKYHNKYDTGPETKTKAYIQSDVMRKTFESSINKRKGLEEEID